MDYYDGNGNMITDAINPDSWAHTPESVERQYVGRKKEKPMPATGKIVFALLVTIWIIGFSGGWDIYAKGFTMTTEIETTSIAAKTGDFFYSPPATISQREKLSQSIACILIPAAFVLVLLVGWYSLVNKITPRI